MDRVRRGVVRSEQSSVGIHSEARFARFFSIKNLAGDTGRIKMSSCFIRDEQIMITSMRVAVFGSSGQLGGPSAQKASNLGLGIDQKLDGPVLIDCVPR